MSIVKLMFFYGGLLIVTLLSVAGFFGSQQHHTIKIIIFTIALSVFISSVGNGMLNACCCLRNLSVSDDDETPSAIETTNGMNNDHPSQLSIEQVHTDIQHYHVKASQTIDIAEIDRTIPQTAHDVNCTTLQGVVFYPNNDNPIVVLHI